MTRHPETRSRTAAAEAPRAPLPPSWWAPLWARLRSSLWARLAPLWARLRSLPRALRWYARELSGESAYDNYLAHRRRTHPGAPVLSRREFDELRTRPTVRCC